MEIRELEKLRYDIRLELEVSSNSKRAACLRSLVRNIEELIKIEKEEDHASAVFKCSKISIGIGPKGIVWERENERNNGQ